MLIFFLYLLTEKRGTRAAVSRMLQGNSGFIFFYQFLVSSFILLCSVLLFSSLLRACLILKSLVLPSSHTLMSPLT